MSIKFDKYFIYQLTDTSLVSVTDWYIAHLMAYIFRIKNKSSFYSISYQSADDVSD